MILEDTVYIENNMSYHKLDLMKTKAVAEPESWGGVPEMQA